MNICFCTHRLPFPPVAGGKRETYKLVESLSKAGHSIDLVTYAADSGRGEELATEVGCSVHMVRGLPNRTLTNLARNVVSLDPLPVMKADTSEFRTKVREHARTADITHLHALQTSFLAADPSLVTPTVIRFNNVKYEIYRQFARYTRNPAKAAYAYLQFVKTRRFERSIPNESELTLAITADDRERLRTPANTAQIEVLPAGVDPRAFDTVPHDPASSVVTFFGSMDYHPNEDAVLWFVDKVLPTIREQLPKVTFEVVGKDPSDTIQALDERPEVRVTGFVEHLDEHVARAGVVVLPIRVGTGIRMKALHAMAMGKPIVSTPLGVQGIDVVDGKHVSLADAPESFAEAVVDLLTEPPRQERYRTEARALVERDHDWATITNQLVDYYESVIADA